MFLRALRTGASDFLLLLNADELRSSIQERLEHKERRFLNRNSIPKDLENDLDSDWNIGDIGHSLGSSLDLNKVFECLLVAAIKVTGADDGQLMILEGESGELVIHAQKHLHEEFISTFRLPNRDAVPSDVFQNGKPAILDFSTSPENITKRLPTPPCTCL